MLTLKASGFWEKLMLVLGLRKLFKVEGSSMNPLLHSGDVVLAKRSKKYRVSDVVISRHPFKSDLIVVKQVKSIGKKGFTLIGVNKLESSHHFGFVHSSKMIGKVTSKLPLAKNGATNGN